jgi:predicted negative regulator of RcsB-dependent stress response
VLEWRTGHFDQASNYLNQGWNAADGIPYDPKMVGLNRAGVAFDQKKYDAALRLYQQTESEARQIEDMEGLGSAIEGEGEVYLAQNDKRRALDSFRRAEAILKRAKATLAMAEVEKKLSLFLPLIKLGLP